MLSSEITEVAALKVATLQLCGCSGCHISFLDVGQSLIDLIKNKRIQLKYSQILMDIKNLEEKIDILLVEGCVLTEHDEEILKAYAGLAEKIVAVGSCACFGGPAAIANQFGRADILKKMFPDSVFSQINNVPSRDLPIIHEFACPIDIFVDVDFYVPGCPPESEILRDFLTATVNGKGSLGYVKTVCDECPLKRTGESPSKIKRIIDVATLDPDKCLVEQGIICMGKMTISGCGAKCPKAGAPCEGCRGFSLSLKEVSPSDAPEIKEALISFAWRKNR